MNFYIDFIKIIMKFFVQEFCIHNPLEHLLLQATLSILRLLKWWLSCLIEKPPHIIWCQKFEYNRGLTYSWGMVLRGSGSMELGDIPSFGWFTDGHVLISSVYQILGLVQTNFLFREFSIQCVSSIVRSAHLCLHELFYQMSLCPPQAMLLWAGWTWWSLLATSQLH